MKTTETIRNWARRFLPAPVRKPLGNLYGAIRERILLPLLGLLFDLKGGRFRADGCVFIIPKDITTAAFRACFLLRTHEVDERKLVCKYLLPEDSVLELGACLGTVSCVTNKRLRKQARHVVVEANPFCLPALRRNRELNQCDFLVENCAVSNQPTVTFYLRSDYIAGGSTKLNSSLPVQVPGRSLKELADRYGPFSTLIMDIEGSELETLEASVGSLLDFRLIIVELHEWVIGPKGIARCHAILQQAGFKMVERSHITEAWLRL